MLNLPKPFCSSHQPKPPSRSDARQNSTENRSGFAGLRALPPTARAEPRRAAQSRAGAPASARPSPCPEPRGEDPPLSGKKQRKGQKYLAPPGGPGEGGLEERALRASRSGSTLTRRSIAIKSPHDVSLTPPALSLITCNSCSNVCRHMGARRMHIVNMN